MKQLILLRHAEAEEVNPKGDKARRLTFRGLRDAAGAGRYLKQSMLIPDIIVTSDASRAVQTSEAAAAELKLAEQLTLNPSIYEADCADILNVVNNIASIYSTAMLVGHNPSFTEIVHLLLKPGDRVPGMPKSGITAISFDTDSWTDVNYGKGTLVMHYSPKRDADGR